MFQSTCFFLPSAVVNACCLALMDAGVQLSSLFLGVTCAVTKGIFSFRWVFVFS